MTGGSVAIDAGTTAGQNYNRGVVEAERLAQSGASNLRGQDESSKLNLLSLAQSGADTTTVAQQSASALRNNLLAGNAGRQTSALGDVFGTFANQYQTSLNNAALRQQQLYGYGGTFGPTPGQGAYSMGYGSGGAYGGPHG